MPERNLKTKDPNLARFDVAYVDVWKCKDCNEAVRMPKDAWDAWSKEQQQMFLDEQKRLHQHEE